MTNSRRTRRFVFFFFLNGFLSFFWTKNHHFFHRIQNLWCWLKNHVGFQQNHWFQWKQKPLRFKLQGGNLSRLPPMGTSSSRVKRRIELWVKRNTFLFLTWHCTCFRNRFKFNFFSNYLFNFFFFFFFRLFVQLFFPTDLFPVTNFFFFLFWILFETRPWRKRWAMSTRPKLRCGMAAVDGSVFFFGFVFFLEHVHTIYVYIMYVYTFFSIEYFFLNPMKLWHATDDAELQVAKVEKLAEPVGAVDNPTDEEWQWPASHWSRIFSPEQYTSHLESDL